MSVQDVLRRLSHGPRRLPASTNGEGPVTVPGLGTFSLTSSGSTAYVTGVDVAFHPEGDEEPGRGSLHFRATVGTGLDVSWTLKDRDFDYGDYDGRRFGAAAWATATHLVSHLWARAEASWDQHVIDAVSMELDPLLRERRDAERHLQDAEARARRRDARTDDAPVARLRRARDTLEARHGARIDLLLAVREAYHRSHSEFSRVPWVEEPLRAMLDRVSGEMRQSHLPAAA